MLRSRNVRNPAPVTPIVEVPIPNIEATIQARVTQGLLIKKHIKSELEVRLADVVAYLPQQEAYT